MARFLAKSMSRSPVLSRLKHLQASLDPLDVGLSACFERSTHVSLYDWPHGRKGLEALDSVGLGETPTNEEWKFFVKLYLSDPDQLIQQTSDLRMWIIAFLLSATFKDCSIFFTMHSPSAPRATLKIVDVDSKPAERLGKFARKDQEIVDWFQALLAEAREAGIRVPACR
jgi:inositol-pentakisphosphate 2-kinase